MMASSLAIVIGSLFDLIHFHRFTYMWTMAVALSGGAMIDLALWFPAGGADCARSSVPAMDWICLGIILALNAYTKLYDFDNPTAYFIGWQMIYMFVGSFGVILFRCVAFHAFFRIHLL